MKLRWIGFPVRFLLFVLAWAIGILVVAVFVPSELDWYEVREHWHRWVLQDRDWREEPPAETEAEK